MKVLRSTWSRYAPVLGVATLVMLAASMRAEPVLPAFWFRAYPTEGEPPDTYALFRGEFQLDTAQEVEIRLLGASWFNAWLDGEFLADGPLRFPLEHPEYTSHRVRLEAGRHVLAAQVQHLGVETRLMKSLPPFLAAEVRAGGVTVPVTWRATPLAGVHSGLRRRSILLGWIEWFDTRLMPDRWRAVDFDASAWGGVVEVKPPMGTPRPATIAPVPHRSVPFREISRGPLARTFGYATDDPPVAFFLADLECRQFPAQGLWRRYDLGKVRLARPRLVLDLPAGAIVEIGSGEALHGGRVPPWTTLSCSPTCFLDRYVARGGVQEFEPQQAQGARYFEVHVYAPTNQIRFVSEEFFERAYYGEPVGDFACDDPLLNRIWRVGIETATSSSEDAVVDSRRERGQWSGDLFVGLRILGTAFADLRLLRRGIVQSALCARPNGLVAALYPGQPEYIPGYAALWTPAVMDYWELTGDRSLLEEMFPYAQRNLAAMLAHQGPNGITNATGLVPELGWNFVDWGYVPNPGPCEVVGNLQILESLRAMIRWCRELRQDATPYLAAEEKLVKAMRDYFAQELAQGGQAWQRIGYQRAVFGLRTGIITDAEAPAAIAMIKAYIRRCFPANPDGERLADPSVTGDFFTPYFANFALGELARRGEMGFVLDQYRDCWGWFLEQGLTTWPEVFDLRWSHCHQWSGSPTWVLSRYVLGFHPRFDRGVNHFDLRVTPGGLKQASGKVALRDGQAVSIRWTRNDGNQLQYEVQTPVPVWLHLPETATPVRVEGSQMLLINPQGK